MKTLIKKSDSTGKPKAKRGWVVWIESGRWFTNKKVNPKKFGPHQFAGGYLGSSKGTGKCDCGCYMDRFDSWGPVDPFGACPCNPKPAVEAPRSGASGEGKA